MTTFLIKNSNFNSQTDQCAVCTLIKQNILIGTKFGILIILSLSNLDKQHKKIHGDKIISLKPMNHFFMSASLDATCNIFMINNQKQNKIKKVAFLKDYQMIKNPIYDCCWNQTAQIVATCGCCFIKLWNVNRPEINENCLKQKDGDYFRITRCSLFIAEKNTNIVKIHLRDKIILALMNNKLRLYQFQKKEVLQFKFTCFFQIILEITQVEMFSEKNRNLYVLKKNRIGKINILSLVQKWGKHQNIKPSFFQVTNTKCLLICDSSFFIKLRMLQNQ